MASTFCVVYRKGGRENFTWHRSEPMSKSAANEVVVGTRRMGYHAMVVDYERSLSIGLPETYDGEDRR